MEGESRAVVEISADKVTVLSRTVVLEGRYYGGTPLREAGEPCSVTLALASISACTLDGHGLRVVIVTPHALCILCFKDEDEALARSTWRRISQGMDGHSSDDIVEKGKRS